MQVTAGFGAALVGERGREQEAVAMVERALSIDPASRAALMAGVKVFGAAGHKVQIVSFLFFLTLRCPMSGTNEAWSNVFRRKRRKRCEMRSD